MLSHTYDEDLARIVAGRPLRFASGSDAFLHRALVDLLAELDRLAELRVSIVQRMSWADSVPALTASHPRARYSWDDVRAAIAREPAYAGASVDLRDEFVRGLVPIGPNPRTTLWEFYHLRSACDSGTAADSVPIPTHEPDGSIAVTDDLGIVFVLVPGGKFVMGAQSEWPDGKNYEPLTAPDDSPIHVVTVAPFFLARHETTKAQWLRLAGKPDPSWHVPGQDEVTLVHPVEFAEWSQWHNLLGEHGLRLPSEAEWEYACRAGTTSPWSCPSNELTEYANIYVEPTVLGPFLSFSVWRLSERYEDHPSRLKPVGSLAPNPWGFFDIHGNVREWCSTAWCDYVPPGITDFLPPGINDETWMEDYGRVYRGGSFLQGPAAARSAYRAYVKPATLSDIGARVARSLGRGT